MRNRGLTVELGAAPVGVVIAAKGVVARDPSQTMIVIALGADLDDADYFALTTHDARRLRRLLDEALVAPTPRIDE